ncbi:MAG: hypothetical protein LUH59_06360 [Firmicutes bacterium]|nr:hypothetical protein [Bacillota bacterium]
MEENELLRRAKYYMDCLASGVNPITEKPFEDVKELDDPRFAKCFSFISGALWSKMSGFGGGSQRRSEREIMPSREKFSLTEEQKASVTISDDYVGINTVAAHINEVIDQNRMYGVSGGKLAESLVALGFLSVTDAPDGSHIRTATEKGTVAGIMTVQHLDALGRDFRQNVYSPEMQRYIVDNIESIIEEGQIRKRAAAAAAAKAEEASAGDIFDGAEGADESSTQGAAQGSAEAPSEETEAGLLF